MTLTEKKDRNRARYLRRCARRRPIAKTARAPRPPMTQRQRLAYLTLREFVPYMQQVAYMNFGAKGAWGHGRYPNGTKKGPGRRRLPPSEQNHPTLTKLVRRFIRGSGLESHFWRRAYVALTGKQYGEVNV